MSLKEAVREVAEAMIDACSAYKQSGVDPMIRMQILSWAGQIITACKAASDAPAHPPGFAHALMPPAVQHATMIERAREEFRKNKEGQQATEKITAIQTGGERILELVGGDNDGVMWPAPADLPEGANTRVGNDYYTYRNGKLEFVRKAQ